MHPLPRWQRRSVGLWFGLVAAWAAFLVVGYLRYRERFGLILVASGVLALVGGIYRTVRLRAQDSEPLITVDDLRRR